MPTILELKAERDALSLEGARLWADLETRRTAPAVYAEWLEAARRLRDSDIRAGKHFTAAAHNGSQDRALRAERCRRHLVRIGEMVDDNDERNAALLELAESSRPPAISAELARSVMQAHIDAAALAAANDPGTQAPRPPLEGYSSEAEITARIAEIQGEGSVPGGRLAEIAAEIDALLGA